MADQPSHYEIMTAIGRLEGKMDMVVSQATSISRNVQRNTDRIGTLAETVAKQDNEIGKLQTRNTVLQWVVGVAITLAGLLWSVFVKR